MYALLNNRVVYFVFSISSRWAFLKPVAIISLIKVLARAIYWNVNERENANALSDLRQLTLRTAVKNVVEDADLRHEVLRR